MSRFYQGLHAVIRRCAEIPDPRIIGNPARIRWTPPSIDPPASLNLAGPPTLQYYDSSMNITIHQVLPCYMRRARSDKQSKIVERRLHSDYVKPHMGDLTQICQQKGYTCVLKCRISEFEDTILIKPPFCWKIPLDDSPFILPNPWVHVKFSLTNCAESRSLSLTEYGHFYTHTVPNLSLIIQWEVQLKYLSWCHTG
jgi:hypothetical protein